MLLKNKLYIWAVVLSFLLIANYFLWQAVVFGYNNKMHIYFLDVGQGDAILIRTPNNKNIIVDGGPDESVIYQLSKVLPIWDKHIDLMILTHPQADHLTGLLEILDRFKVKEILTTQTDYPTKTNQAWLDKLSNCSCIINWADASDDYYFGEVYIDTLWPIDSDFINTSNIDVNEASVVNKIVYGNNSVLLTGDLGFSSEKKLLNIYPSIESDVLKIGHHGSKYASSQEFLSAVKPETAVISVGQNSYGHPSDDTLNRLNDVGADVYRTDISGNIEIVFDKESYLIK